MMDMKISKICLPGIFLVYFLHIISAIFFFNKLVIFLLSHIMSNIAFDFKGQKILFQSFCFLVQLGEIFLGFYLLLIGLFFLERKDKQIKFW